MRILYIAHRVPYPPDKGEKIRAFHQITHLARTHEVHLACMVSDKSDLQHIDPLRRHCTSVDFEFRSRFVGKSLALTALLTSKPLSAAYFYSRNLRHKIATRLGAGGFDVIVVSSSGMAGHVFRVPGPPRIMDFVDADSEKWRQYAEHHRAPMSWVYRTEANRLARWEETIATSFNHSIVVTEKEAKVLRKRAGDRPVTVIPNGVDLDYFSSNGSQREIEEPCIVFTGVMSYFPNVDAVCYFAAEVFPLVREALPTARFCIVGRDPVKRVTELGKLRNITVTGTVVDVRPYLGRAAIAVAPLRIARGMQNKVLEAMSMGLPVVTTPGVLEGLQATPSDGIQVAGNATDFAREVIALLQNPALRAQCSSRARRYVERRHRWEDVGAHLEKVIREVASSTASRVYA